MTTLNQASFRIQTNILENLIEAVENMRSQMPGLVHLTANQKKSLMVPGDKTTPFIDKALEYAERTPEITPGYIKIDEWQTDVDAIRSLNKLRRVMSELLGNIEDTIALSGNDAYRTALQYYQAMKTAAKGGVDRAKQMLAELELRFPRGKGAALTSPPSDGVSVIIEDGKIVGPVTGDSGLSGSGPADGVADGAGDTATGTGSG